MEAIHTVMKDGRELCLRRLTSEDAPLIEAGIKDLSDRSRYLRFFSGFKQAPPSVLQKLTNFDTDNHLAWGAVDASLPSYPPIAAAHIIRMDPAPETTGDFALAVLDDYQGLGVARAMMSCLFHDALTSGFETVHLDVLFENMSARSLFTTMGAVSSASNGGVIHMELDLKTALRKLEMSKRAPVADMFKDVQHALNG